MNNVTEPTILSQVAARLVAEVQAEGIKL